MKPAQRLSRAGGKARRERRGQGHDVSSPCSSAAMNQKHIDNDDDDTGADGTGKPRTPNNKYGPNPPRDSNGVE